MSTPVNRRIFGVSFSPAPEPWLSSECDQPVWFLIAANHDLGSRFFRKLRTPARSTAC